MGYRLVLVDDHDLFRQSIAAALRTTMKVEVAGSFPTVQAALDRFAVLAGADVALIDVKLAEGDAFELVAMLKRNAPRLRLIWVTAVAEDYLIHRALEAQLPGFVHKEDSLETLMAAIETVAQGGCFVSDRIQRRKEELFAKPDFFPRVLSDREQQIMRYVGSGYSDQETGALLGLSAATVQTHRRNIMAKLGIHSAPKLQAYAQQHGFTGGPAVTPPARPPRAS